MIAAHLQPSDAKGLLELYTSDARVARGNAVDFPPVATRATEQFIARATAPNHEEEPSWVLDGAGHDRAAVPEG